MTNQFNDQPGTKDFLQRVWIQKGRNIIPIRRTVQRNRNNSTNDGKNTMRFLHNQELPKNHFEEN